MVMLAQVRRMGPGEEITLSLLIFRTSVLLFFVVKSEKAKKNMKLS